jgi:hypothetical protein
MPTAYSHLAGRDVDTASEDWRHECECRWLLSHKPTRHDKHMYLYGVPDRERLMAFNRTTGKFGLADDHTKRWVGSDKPLMHNRGLEAVDRLLADARTIYEKRT